MLVMIVLRLEREYEVLVTSDLHNDMEFFSSSGTVVERAKRGDPSPRCVPSHPRDPRHN